MQGPEEGVGRAGRRAAWGGCGGGELEASEAEDAGEDVG